MPSGSMGSGTEIHSLDFVSVLLGHSIFLLLNLIFLSVPLPKTGSLNISPVVEVYIIGRAYFLF